MANGNQRTDQGRASNVHELVVDGLPPCTMARIADATWHVVAQLATDDQAALMAAVTHPDTLCQGFAPQYGQCRTGLIAGHHATLDHRLCMRWR